MPELASRDHIRQTLPLIRATLEKAGLTREDIHGIAYTRGPGLIGALLVGATVARSLGWAWGIPTIGVHHLEAHLMAVMLEDPVPEAPFVALLVSGGHTQLIAVEGEGQYQLLGETVDDAVGEAFDKTAKLFRTRLPGWTCFIGTCQRRQPGPFSFSLRPMVSHPDLNFTF